MSLHAILLPLGELLLVWSLLVGSLVTTAGERLATQRGRGWVPQVGFAPPLTEEAYLQGLWAADDSTFRHRYEVPFLLLLDESQQQSYLLLDSLEHRKAFIERYWKASNPDPLLPQNDWLVDFLRRCAYVWKNFPTQEPPYFDDRGKYYIKYGKPQARYQDGGGFRRITFFRNDDPRANYTVIPNETWSYENVVPDFIVHFVQQGTIFREARSLIEALVDRRRAIMVWQWGDMVKRRAAVSPVLGKAAMKVHELETVLLHAAVSGRPGLLRGETASPPDRILEIVRANEETVSRASREAPPAAREGIQAKNRLVFHDQIAQFRAPDGRTRLRVFVLSPLRKNLVKRLDPQAQDSVDVEFAMLLRDESYDPVASTQAVEHLPLRLALAESLPNAVGSLSVDADPGTGDLTVQVKDLRKGRIGFRRRPLVVRDFQGRGLMLSDILLLAEAPAAARRRLLPVVVDEALPMVPYPYRKTQRRRPLFCYFEVYNLRAAGVGPAYEVTYSVVLQHRSSGVVNKISELLSGSGEAAIRVTVDRPVVSDTGKELISLDLSNLVDGDYELEVTVTAKGNQSLTARATRQLTVVE